MTKQEMQAKMDKQDAALDKAKEETALIVNHLRTASEHKADYEAIERAFPESPHVAHHNKRTLLTRIQDELDQHDGIVANAVTSLAETKAVLRTLAVEHWGATDALPKLAIAVHGVERDYVDGSSMSPPGA